MCSWQMNDSQYVTAAEEVAQRILISENALLQSPHQDWLLPKEPSHLRMWRHWE